MNSESEYVFYGDLKRRPKEAHPDSPQKPEPYVASDDLKRAVNLAIFLRRPLLLEGEAGCGKTRLARAVAYELGLPFYPWYVRSTSQAQEGLYSYDAILRLHDVQTRKLEEKIKQRDPRRATDYRQLGPLGRAFDLKDLPAVVLIDEIDKADVDFPNDLLTVLDDPWSFKIPETGERVTASHTPIVIITSNKEKDNLPAPFLRRCIYYYLEFPNSPARLQEIINAHYTIPAESSLSLDLATAAVERFLNIRSESGLRKKPGISEFLDWLEALHNFDPLPYPALKLAKDKGIPFRELLFKLRADWRHHPSTV